MQGQDFENIGDETLFWYAPWPEQKSDGIRTAVWRRDRLGYFQAYSHGPLTDSEEEGPHIVSAPIDLEDQSALLSLNINQPHEYCGVSVEILDGRFAPVEGYTHADCQPPSESGFKQVVKWADKTSIEGVSGRIRIRVDFTGIRFEDVHLYAVYLDLT